jgi:TldD protein
MLKIEDLDRVKGKLNALAEEAASAVDCAYADIRLELGEVAAALSENGAVRRALKDAYLSLGVRVIAKNGCPASGHAGLVLGSADSSRLDRVIREALNQAGERARANARAKQEVHKKFPQLGRTLIEWPLAEIPVTRVDVPAMYEVDPRSITPGMASHLTGQVSTMLLSQESSLMYNAVSAETAMIRELFASSEGCLIDRPYPLTQGTVYVVAQDNGVSQEHYDYIGHQRGWEILTQGISAPLLASEPLETFASNLAHLAAELCSTPPLKATDKPVVVVTDPSFNALVAHEVIGHPTEADRVLKWETAYAGRSWFFGDMTRNQLGNQVASSLVTAYSDPSLPGFGHYSFDHEGTPGREILLIDKGVISGFMNSRETSGILGTEPNGHYKATDASLVPLIRMSTTVIANGDTPPDKLIGEVEHGWYLCGMRTPSISESRENFRISAKKVVEISRGHLGQVYRDGGITSDTKEFFMSIDRVGNDFRVYPIPNCGKGQPMQTKKLGNGGPTLRGRARLTGV